MNEYDEYIENIRIKEPIVGQKVIIFGYIYSKELIGEIGKVILVDKNSVIIEFKESDKMFHSGVGLGKDHHCWAIDKRVFSIFKYSIKNKNMLKKYLSKRDDLVKIGDNLAKVCWNQNYDCSGCVYYTLSQ